MSREITDRERLTVDNETSLRRFIKHSSNYYYELADYRFNSIVDPSPENIMLYTDTISVVIEHDLSMDDAEQSVIVDKMALKRDVEYMRDVYFSNISRDASQDSFVSCSIGDALYNLENLQRSRTNTSQTQNANAGVNGVNQNSQNVNARTNNNQNLQNANTRINNNNRNLQGALGAFGSREIGATGGCCTIQ